MEGGVWVVGVCDVPHVVFVMCDVCCVVYSVCGVLRCV